MTMPLADDTMSLESKNKPLQQSSQGEKRSSQGERPKGHLDVSKEISNKEREITRLILIAEKDKRDSMLLSESTKRLNDQVTSIIRDFYTDPVKAEEVLLRCVRISREETNSTDNARRSFGGSKPIPTPKNSNATSTSLDIENKSPNTPPDVDSCMDELRKKEEELRKKEEELERVRLRAVEESARAEALKNKEKGLRELLNSELNKVHDLTSSLKTRIFEKEKEISRYTILAERDKKAGMQMTDQITRLRKSLQGFISAHTATDGPPQQIFDLLARCDVTSDVTSRSPPPPGMSKVPSMRPVSSLGMEYYQLLCESAKKSDELNRVRTIADNEVRKKEIIKSKVDELKTGLVQQIQEVDAKVGTQVKAIQGQHQAIEKVAQRAEREISRSQFLHEAIDELSQSIAEEKLRGTTPVRSHIALKPEKVELYVSPEIKDLKPTAATLVPNKIVNSLQDPASMVQSSPTKKLSIGEGSSEALYFQKIQELEILRKEKVSGEQHLIKLKNLADEERQRNKLLVDRFIELQDEMRYIQSSKDGARTY